MRHLGLLKQGGSAAGISRRHPLLISAQACWSPFWIQCPELWPCHCFRSEEVAKWGKCLLCHHGDQHPLNIRVWQEVPVTLAHRVEGTQRPADPWSSLRSQSCQLVESASLKADEVEFSRGRHRFGFQLLHILICTRRHTYIYLHTNTAKEKM